MPPLTNIEVDRKTPLSEAAAEAKLPSLHDFFSPGGILARSSLAFEHRPGQYAMSKAIEQAFADRRHLIIEAGTGTGKTLAYLLPALRRARREKQRIIISTGTKNLQEQLYFKDIPFLESVLADAGPLRVCYMKGRANYLCKQKLYALRDNPILSGLDDISQFHTILQWERTTETGDRAEIDDLPESSALWHKLDARSEVCLGQTCPNWEPCFVTQMRRKALESDLVIVNHHLFFADLSIKQQAAGAPDAGILPEAAAVIFDEAHELEDVASQYFGIALTSHRFDELARDTEAMLRAKGASSPAIESSTVTLRERSRLFFSSLPAGASPDAALAHPGRMEFTDRQDFLESHGDSYLAAINALTRLEGELDRLRDVEEAAGLRKRAADIRAHLKFLLESTDPNTVFWIERRTASNLRNAGAPRLAPETWAGSPTNPSSRPNPARAQRVEGGAETGSPASLLAGVQRPLYLSLTTHLQATPIDVSQLLAETLFANYASVILTSATLTVADSEGKPSFKHLKKRLGIPFPKELVVPSHFDYAKQALLYLPQYLPPPRHPDFLPHAAEKIRRVLEITRGRAFCLFTSYSQMRELHDRLLSQLPFPLLLQGQAPRHVLIQQFRETPNAVLFGTSSFWQGIDVQGEQLSCVIVDKLPFAVPSDPILKARTDAIAAAGGNPFNDLQVPQAVIALKQGFGRLIRSLTDRGVLMLLDSRIRTTRYGATFLDSLPPYSRTDDIAEVERFFASN